MTEKGGAGVKKVKQEIQLPGNPENERPEEKSRKKKIKARNLAPMLSAAVVAVSMGVSLSAYTPAVYEVQARPAQEEEDGTDDTGSTIELLDLPEETETEGEGSTSVETVEEAGTYRDGTYYGSAAGFAGTITVKVVISGGQIISVEIVETSDGSEYISKASSLIQSIISGQTTNVDTVSGATYSSVGIINAVRNALAQAAVSGSEAAELQTEAAVNLSSGRNTGSSGGYSGGTISAVPSVSGNFPYPDGTYYGEGEGYWGTVRVAVVIKDQTIASVTIVSTDDDEEYFSRATAVAENVVTQQTTSVDTVSGATYSSRGILDAICAALAEAEAAGRENSQTGQNQVTGNTADADGKNEGSAGETSQEETETGEDTTEEISYLYNDGDYTVTVLCEPDEFEDFTAYNLTATVTIQGDRITGISDISGDGDSSNDRYINRAASGTSSITGMISRILDLLKPDVLEEDASLKYQESVEALDTVSGATCTSNSIKEACTEALQQARKDSDEEVSDQDM